MRVFLFLLMFGYQTSKAQFTEHFDDGEFIDNPSWIGNADNWKVNDNGQLQSDNSSENATFYLSTTSVQAHGQWDFNVQLDFSTSGSNYVDVYGISSTENPSLISSRGYFVRIGNTDDEISLYRRDGNNIVKIIDGLNGSVASSSSNVNIRLIRDSANRFILLRDLGITGNYICEGIIVDSTYLTSQYFSLFVKQSTSSFFRKHFFDDIIVQPFVPDNSAPVILEVNVINENSIKLLFNETLERSSAENIQNYLIENNFEHPVAAFLDSLNSANIILNFANPFEERATLHLKISNIKDLWNNSISNITANFNFIKPQQFDVVINELMADPQPVVGLPDMEWIEIKNRSGFDINLENWKLCIGNSESGYLPSYNLKADSLLIICSPINKSVMEQFGNCLDISTFPALPNEGAVLFLKSPTGKTIHSISYSDKWYNNPVKKIGGYSLEMIDSNNPCSGKENWTASNNISGGTPGKVNSVNEVNIDESHPFIKRAYATDSVSVYLYFSEAVDSSASSLGSNYTINNIVIENANALPPLFNVVKLKLTTSLQRNIIYQVMSSNITDCAGNEISHTSVKFGLHEPANPEDIVINEVLFNPSPSGVDFVELYNRGNKLLDLKNIYISNRGSDGSLNPPVQISLIGQTFFPGNFIVLSRDGDIVKREYVSTNPEAFIDITMPAFNDDKGNVVLLNSAGDILDELNYSEKWHFALISNTEGISLERMNYKGFSNNKELWTSASKSFGYATPAYKNSQFLADESSGGEVSVYPKIISPDNDGLDDFAMIDYEFKKPGMVCSIIIFDASGRPVRYLQRNVLAGIKGSFRWDGLGERLRKLPEGLYIVYTEAMSLSGKIQKFKNAIVIGYRK